MRKTAEVENWVVYQTVEGMRAGRKTVCVESEWETAKASKSERNSLVREGIVNECEAEKLARGTSGDVKRRGFCVEPVAVSPPKTVS